MNKVINEIIIEHQRLTILKRLSTLPSYSSNAFIMQAELINNGLSASLNEVKKQLNWLAEHNLTSLSSLSVKLTQHGLDVANGYCLYDGVARPPPEE